MTLRISHLLRRLLLPITYLIATMVLAVILAAGVSQPALAQEDKGGEQEPGALTKGWVAGKAFLDGLTGPDSNDDSGSGDGDQNSGEGSGNGSGEGSSDGGGNAGGGDWESSGSGGMSEEASQGRFGPWTGIINLLLGLLTAAGGIGIASGIGLLATAAGRESQIETGKKVLEGSFGGFLIGTMAIPVYEVVTRVVVGF